MSRRVHPNTGTGRYTLPAPLRAPGVFGTVGRAPIPRERPLGGGEYGLFALSGALGCALTHSLVVPLDVVKTRIQTRPGQYAGFVDAFSTIRREEGAAMLLQGLGATVSGYFLYGVSVYPGYEACYVCTVHVQCMHGACTAHALRTLDPRCPPDPLCPLLLPQPTSAPSANPRPSH